MAAPRVFPKRRLVIGHSLGHSYLYWFDGMEGVPDGDLAAHRGGDAGARRAATCPSGRVLLSYGEAVEYFAAPQPARHLAAAEEPQRPRGPRPLLRRDPRPLARPPGPLHGPAVGLRHPGLCARVPPALPARRKIPLRVAPFSGNPVLFSIYREYKNWGKILRVGSVGSLNELIRAGGDPGVRPDRRGAAGQEDRRDRRQDQRAARPGAGRADRRPLLVGQDHVLQEADDPASRRGPQPRDDLPGRLLQAASPRRPATRRESPTSSPSARWTCELLNDHLVRLLRGEEVETPLFDFLTGTRKPQGRTMRLPGPGDPHPGGDPRAERRADAAGRARARSTRSTCPPSPSSTSTTTTGSRPPTTGSSAGMVRDNQFRGHPALRTLSMWPSVRRGEDRNIFPFQNSADSAFNSALDYELAVLKVYAEPLLASVKPDVPEYQEARALLVIPGQLHAPAPAVGSRRPRSCASSSARARSSTDRGTGAPTTQAATLSPGPGTVGLASPAPPPALSREMRRRPRGSPCTTNARRGGAGLRATPSAEARPCPRAPRSR